MLSLQGKLTAENGALLLAALKAIEVDTKAEALVALARGEAKPCELVVHLDADSLIADKSGMQCELEDGPALAPETARRLGCDAAVVMMVERNGKPLSVGRRTRAIPPSLRRALKRRDDGCQFPGCTHTRWLHAHHIQHWARGGPTELANLVQLCSEHHRMVHEGGFGVECGSGGEIRFWRPSGADIPHCFPVEWAQGPTVEHQNQAAQIQIDDTTCAPKSAGDRLDYDMAVIGLMASVEVRDQRPDGLLGTAAVGPDEPTWTPLDPARDIHPVTHTPRYVGDSAGLFIERESCDWPAAVADRGQDQAGIELLDGAAFRGELHAAYLALLAQHPDWRQFVAELDDSS